LEHKKSEYWKVLTFFVSEFDRVIYGNNTIVNDKTMSAADNLSAMLFCAVITYFLLFLEN